MTQSEEDGSISQQGACPDVQDDVTSVSGFRQGCTTCIKFARPLVSCEYLLYISRLIYYYENNRRVGAGNHLAHLIDTSYTVKLTIYKISLNSTN